MIKIDGIYKKGANRRAFYDMNICRYHGGTMESLETVFPMNAGLLLTAIMIRDPFLPGGLLRTIQEMIYGRFNTALSYRYQEVL